MAKLELNVSKVLQLVNDKVNNWKGQMANEIVSRAKMKSPVFRRTLRDNIIHKHSGNIKQSDYVIANTAYAHYQNSTLLRHLIDLKSNFAEKGRILQQGMKGLKRIGFSGKDTAQYSYGYRYLKDNTSFVTKRKLDYLGNALKEALKNIGLKPFV